MLGWLGVTSNQCCIWKCIFGVTFNANMLVARCSPRSNDWKEVDPPLVYRRLAQVYTECKRPRPSFWSPPWLQDTCSQCRSMQKPWGSNRSYVGLLPRIELCRASLREDPYWWISSLHTDDRGKVSNPPYIHLHLSFKPLSTDHHNCLLYKSRWDALTTSSSASFPLARTVADRPLFRRGSSEAPREDWCTQKWISWEEEGNLSRFASQKCNRWTSSFICLLAEEE